MELLTDKKRYCQICRKDIKSYKFWDAISYEDMWVIQKNGDVWTYRLYWHTKCLKKNKDDKEGTSNTPFISAS
jgi:hypothetical protein